MAKISAAERATNKELFDALIVEQFMIMDPTERIDEVITHGKLSKVAGVSKSTFTNYYPDKAALFAPLAGQIFPRVIKSLEMLGTKDEFIDSWLNAWDSSPLFRNIITLLLSNAFNSGAMARGGFIRLERMLAGSLGNVEAKDALQRCIGLTIYRAIIEESPIDSAA
ncbi:TetR/AcrR family transcriptional regulator [Vibrio sp. WXL210]|uniref:TetR/AcrR family transcriptional regulator n=1 Tax=Vibrio sp. WXL210 TaxID=3450709 RepID=UPI003EC50612